MTPRPESEERPTDSEQLAAAKIVVDDTITLARTHGWQDGVMLHWLDEQLSEVERLRAECVDLRSVNGSMSDDNESLSRLVDENDRLRASLVEATRDTVSPTIVTANVGIGFGLRYGGKQSHAIRDGDTHTLCGRFARAAACNTYPYAVRATCKKCRELDPRRFPLTHCHACGLRFDFMTVPDSKCADLCVECGGDVFVIPWELNPLRESSPASLHTETSR